MAAKAAPEKKTGLDLLREPFPPHQISLLPKPFKKDSPKGNCTVCGKYHGLPAAHLEYVGHAALTDRLLEADPKWTWEPMALAPDGLPLFDRSGGLWIKLTVCGLTRLGYGNAEDSSYKDKGAVEKEIIGDALRNAGMRFGAALDLWHKGDLRKDDSVDTEAEPEAPKGPPPPIADANAEPPPRNETPITMQEVESLYTMAFEKRKMTKQMVDDRVNLIWKLPAAKNMKRWQLAKIIHDLAAAK